MDLHNKSPWFTTPAMPLYIGIVAISATCGLWLFKAIDHPIHDFANSYFGAYFLINDRFDHGIFDPYTFNTRIYNEGFRNIFASYNPNPPFTALFFVPFALLPPDVAKAAFNVLSCLLFLTAVFRLCAFFRITDSPWLIVLPLILLVPVRNHILFGQSYFLIFFLMVEGFLAAERKKDLMAALLWGLAIFIKVFPAIVFLYLILKRKWKTAALLGSVCFGLFLLSAAIQGTDLWKDYLIRILPRIGQGEISGSYVPNYQSALMLFKYAFMEDPQLNPAPLIKSVFLFKLFQILFSAMVITACASVILKHQSLLAFGILLMTVIMISPYGNTYSAVLLSVIVVASVQFNKKQSLIIIGLIALIANLPLSIFDRLPALLRFPRLMLMVILFVFIFAITKAKFNWRIFLIFLIAFTVPALLSPREESDPSTFLLDKQKHSLVFDYSVSNGSIVYRHWSDEGEQVHDTGIPVSSFAPAAAELRDNQIYFKGKQITESADAKLKPALIDGRAIIYLSDKDRGTGFYNLRRIHLKDVGNL